MLRASGSPAAVSSLPAWTILFAREPEPDLDLDETSTDMDETGHPDEGGGAPQGSGGDKKQKLIKLVLLAVLAGAGLYVAMDPSVLIGPSEEPAPTPAPVPPKAAQAPAPAPKPAAPPAPMAPAPQAPASSPAPATTPQPMAQQAMPAAPPTSAPPQPKPMMPAAASAPAPAVPSVAPLKPATATSFSPLFSEGQQVLVLADPAKPTGPVSLMADAGSGRPGPTVAPNATATVQDGELQNNGWVYSIRTAQGATGWVSEKQLRAK